MEKTPAEELREEMMYVFRRLARYWADNPREMTLLQRCEGLVFSILVQLDGQGQLPAFDLIAHVHPDDDDQKYEGVVISDVLHEHFFKESEK